MWRVERKSKWKPDYQITRILKGSYPRPTSQSQMAPRRSATDARNLRLVHSSPPLESESEDRASTHLRFAKRRLRFTAWPQKLIAIVVVLAVSGALFYHTWWTFLAAWITRNKTVDPAIYERAIRYDPQNADYH